MTGASPRIVAAQAVVVGVLIIVVFVTLLRPEGASRLFGIEAPGDRAAPATATPAHSPARAGGRDRHGTPDTGGAPHRGGGGAPGTQVIPVTPAASTGLPAPAGSDGGPGSPADDQYGDSLARLQARLH